MTVKHIVGYTDPLSVEPGDVICAYLSSSSPVAEDVEIKVVRMLAGDASRGSPGLRYAELKTAVDGTYRLSKQSIQPGSYGLVKEFEVSAQRSLTVQVNAKLTLARPSKQVLICIGQPWGGQGLSLYIDESGRPAVALSLTGTTAEVATTQPLELERWYRLTAAIEAGGKLEIEIVDLGDSSRGYIEQFEVSVDSPIQAQPPTLMLAAAPASSKGPTRPQDTRWHFNGLLERPLVVVDRLLTAVERRELSDPNSGAGAFSRNLIGLWEFSDDIGTWRITDRSERHHEAELFNLPRQAVCGSNWDRSVTDWRTNPRMYGAIHFLADAVGDCHWEPTCQLRIPSALRSGFYAFLVDSGNEIEYLPFFVKPATGRVESCIALIAPTATYLSYANSRFWWEDPIQEAVADRLVEIGPEDEWVLNHPEVGPSCYDAHDDLTDVCYASRRRPNLAMRPGHLRHEGYVSDLYLINWLEHHGYSCDVFTDEDLDQRGADLLAKYGVVLTGTHPEYVSIHEWDALKSYRDAGGRIMYLGGNGFHTRIAFDPARPWVMENRRTFGWFNPRESATGEHHFSLDGELGGYLAGVGRPPHDLVGVDSITMGFDESKPYRRGPASRDPRASFVFEGVREELIGDFGLMLGGAVGQEWDNAAHFVPPAGHMVLGSSENHSMLPALFGAQMKPFHADLVLWLQPGGGAVFSASSMAWGASLSHNAWDNNVSKIMNNVLMRFLDPEPFVDV